MHLTHPNLNKVINKISIPIKNQVSLTIASPDIYKQLHAQQVAMKYCQWSTNHLFLMKVN